MLQRNLKSHGDPLTLKYDGVREHDAACPAGQSVNAAEERTQEH
jgi:hypothetical protein